MDIYKRALEFHRTQSELLVKRAGWTDAFTDSRVIGGLAGAAGGGLLGWLTGGKKEDKDTKTGRILGGIALGAAGGAGIGHLYKNWASMKPKQETEQKTDEPRREKPQPKTEPKTQQKTEPKPQVGNTSFYSESEKNRGNARRRAAEARSANSYIANEKARRQQQSAQWQASQDASKAQRQAKQQAQKEKMQREIEKDQKTADLLGFLGWMGDKTTNGLKTVGRGLQSGVETVFGAADKGLNKVRDNWVNMLEGNRELAEAQEQSRRIDAKIAARKQREKDRDTELKEEQWQIRAGGRHKDAEGNMVGSHSHEQLKQKAGARQVQLAENAGLYKKIYDYWRNGIIDTESREQLIAELRMGKLPDIGAHAFATRKRQLK